RRRIDKAAGAGIPNRETRLGTGATRRGRARTRGPHPRSHGAARARTRRAAREANSAGTEGQMAQRQPVITIVGEAFDVLGHSFHGHAINTAELRSTQEDLIPLTLDHTEIA